MISNPVFGPLIRDDRKGKTEIHVGKNIRGVIRDLSQIDNIRTLVVFVEQIRTNHRDYKKFKPKKKFDIVDIKVQKNNEVATVYSNCEIIQIGFMRHEGKILVLEDIFITYQTSHIVIKEGIKMTDLEKKVIELVAEAAGFRPEEVALDHNYEDLGLDSLDAVELVMAIEDEFELEISDDEAEKFCKVTDIVDWLKKAKEPKPNIQHMLKEVLRHLSPLSREDAITITKIEEAIMWQDKSKEDK